MSRCYRTVFAALLLLGLGFDSKVPAQAGYGELAGVVTDTTHATIPNASVKLTSSATAQSRETTTSTGGEYLFTAVPISGSYTLTITAPGFTAFGSPRGRAQCRDDYHPGRRAYRRNVDERDRGHRRSSRAGAN